MSGLCRVNLIKKYLQQGNTFVYITRVDYRVCRKLKLPTADERHTYLGIAALKIVRVHASHEDAAKTFTSRRYIVAPDPTLYPPNLAHDLRTRVAVQRESCIVSVDDDDHTVHYTPDCSTDAQWWKQVKTYYVRQRKNKLPAAECCLVQVGGREAIQLDPAHAPIFTPADWGSKQMNLPGIELQAVQADQLCQRIVWGR